MINHCNRYGATGAHPSYGWTTAAARYNPPMRDLARFTAAMAHAAYPRIAAYDPLWVFESSMGPINLWLLEGLAERMKLKPGMRVLDLGCGQASSSIFLAREYGVEVIAADLWIDAADNAARIAEAGLTGQIEAVHADAHSLPFAPEQFDAAISIDAWHYFGTDVRYLAYFAGFIKPGGTVGIVIPSNCCDPDEPDALPCPPELAADFGADWYCFRSLAWWQRHWSRTPGLTIELAEEVPGGREDWLRQLEASEAHYGPTDNARVNTALLASEAGAQFGLSRLIARRE